MSESERSYRIIFTQDEEVYEIYCSYISEETLMGFIEVEALMFDQASTIVVDPSEERLKNEFKNVKRSYIPMHMILRIDEMDQPGVGKIKDQFGDKADNIRPFPGSFKRDKSEPER